MSEQGVDAAATGNEPESEPPSSGGLAAVGTSVAVGMTLGGRWQLDGVVGEGGTATVYRGRDLERAAAVAVKVLRPAFARDGAMRERFRREARAANLVQHPAAVRVLGDGALADGTPYIVMEMLEGETLEARLARKGQRLPATEVLWAIDKVLDVLVAAHERGLVHRDLKPENIFLTDDRQVKVLDFGLARLKESAGSQALTRIGFVMGTPSYMPPEQASGQWDQVDVQTDLWAVGATMFFLLSGRLVHEGQHVHEVVAAATRQAAPSLRQAAPHLPEAVVEVVDFALAFDMDKRWRSARTMQIAVRRAHRQLQRGERAVDRGDDDDEEPIEETSLEGEDDMEPPPATRRASPAGGLLLSPSTERLLHEGDTLPAIDMREAVATVRRQHPTPPGQRPPSLSDPALADPDRPSGSPPAEASSPDADAAPLSRRGAGRGWGLAAVVVAVAAVSLLGLLVAR